MRRRIIWLDGEFVRADGSFLCALTPGVLKARGVFETLRARNGRLARLDDHLRRMSRGLKVLGMRRPDLWKEIPSKISQVVRANRLKDARVRLMVWQKGKRLHGAVIAEPFHPPTARAYEQGFKALLIHGHRRRTRVPIKSLDYGIFRRSFQKARAAGYDEAILLNRTNKVVEGSRTNIFWVKDEVLFTPPVTAGCLPGVARQAVLKRARRMKVRCLSRRLTAADLLKADEAFLTNALLGVMPLTRVGPSPVGTGKPGPVTLKLRENI